MCRHRIETEDEVFGNRWWGSGRVGRFSNGSGGFRGSAFRAAAFGGRDMVLTVGADGGEEGGDECEDGGLVGGGDYGPVERVSGGCGSGWGGAYQGTLNGELRV